MIRNGVHRAREQGVVLIIALIFLLMLSLIGVSAMQGTTIQEKMAGNLRDQISAFNAAEAALREGELNASQGFDNGTFVFGAPISGVHAASFAGPSIPSWNARVISYIYVSPDFGSPPDGAVISVTASSAGVSGQSDVQLESIYVVQ
ncbi:pilus assembly PilX family protein [Aliamphritea spongicola]|uniref:pilus assembly PilX family protein n=1 Tax=Aliamphritea spongicola TaxID=707589 RepID=UPI00196B796E|nr:PilX N-terminal domain-containing pilus assembly protein [Aliamphritea spongicola]MBN3562481.1 hypothetical protein [Aliamphritea spongicola]